MLDTDDRQICGNMSSVFISTENNLAPPAVERGGVGVMRVATINRVAEYVA